MAAPSSAKESGPKRERIAPTIQAAKTTLTKRPSRAISAGFRKMPVPIMVPTTMAAEAQAPRPRTSSRRFSVMSPLTEFWRVAQLSQTGAQQAAPLRSNNSADGPAHKERDERANHEVPRVSHARKLEYT